MGYMHIDNLYKNQDILFYKECYALEKIHGTSAHIQFKEGKLILFSGGEKYARFETLFNQADLLPKLEAIGGDFTVYGEAYGGSQQKQQWRYGKDLKFVAFDVLIGRGKEGAWLTVPQAAELVAKLGLEFVHYEKVSTDLAVLDAQRDQPSTQAKRNSIEGDQPQEGVVLRPLIEVTKNSGARIIAKHKRDDERETNKPRKVVDTAKLEVLTKANDIAVEWVTPTRLEHVLDKIDPNAGMERTGDVIKAMIEDVEREGAVEIVMSKEARQAIGVATAKLFKARLKNALVEKAGQ